ncbi:recombination regulator RecX [Bacillus sp. BRMEA1]|uniref:recombination regulator RecX n=1 Tax=Neobacillus endophyticus TaxID=2738405 RepID=UPI0015672848|nr:recombination regulator RecX [Neobacillus endophyticus]NRD78214.1 recombination regulator RecX [Neobacillus endophyticus]
MTIITKITTQQKNTDRFNIFMDDGTGEKYAFSIDSDTLIKFQLKKGMELDDFSLMEIQYQDDIRKAYNLAIHYLARRMRSEKEVRDYLLQKEAAEPAIDEVIHKLSAQKYVNDQEFAFAFVRTQVNTTDKGPDLIKLELKEKGISPEIFMQALADFTKEKQIEKAVKMAQKALNKTSKDSWKIQKQKLEQLLLRKGYTFDVIQIAIEENEVEKEDDTEFEAIRFQGNKLLKKFSGYSGYEFEQRVKQALYRKGFSIEFIERFLSESKKS